MIKTLRFSSMKSWLPWILLACFYIGKSQTKRFDMHRDVEPHINTGLYSCEFDVADNLRFNLAIQEKSILLSCILTNYKQ